MDDQIDLATVRYKRIIVKTSPLSDCICFQVCYRNILPWPVPGPTRSRRASRPHLNLKKKLTSMFHPTRTLMRLLTMAATLLTSLRSPLHFLLFYLNYLRLWWALARPMIFSNSFASTKRGNTGTARPASKKFFFLTFTLTPWHSQSNFREMPEKDPKAKVPRSIRYKITTAYSNLRAHMEAHHKEMYVALCQANGWTFKLPGEQKVCRDCYKLLRQC